MSKKLGIDELIDVIQQLEKARFDKTNWRTLGGTLGLHPNTLNIISANQRGDTDGCFGGCLSKWLRRADNVDKVGKPSFNTLADALDKMNGCKDQADYIRNLAQEGDTGKTGKKNAKSTGPKIDSTKKSSKDGGAKASGGDEDTDGPDGQGGSPQSKANKQQNPLCSFMCSGWVILPLCIAAVAVVLMIYLPSYQQMKGKEGEPTNHVHVHPEDVKPPQAPISTTAGAKPSLEGPPTKRHTTVQLDNKHLVEILDLLKKHGYSGVSYYDLGLYLGLHPGTLDAIEAKNKGDVCTCLRECLKKWLQQADDVKSVGAPTYDTLIKVLRKMGENAVADGIEQDTNTS